MFLKKKQTDGETNDALQQIKAKISDTNDGGAGNSQNQSLQTSFVSQNTNNENNYSDEDDELLNMLLSDDNDDDDDEEVNELSNTNDDIVDTNIDTDNNLDNVVNVASGVQTNNNTNENIASSPVGNISVDKEDYNIDVLEENSEDNDEDDGNNDSQDNLTGPVVDGLLNDIKNKITEKQEHNNDGVKTAVSQFRDEDDIDEDDIELYDGDKNDVEEDGGDESEVINAKELDYDVDEDGEAVDDEEIYGANDIKDLTDEENDMLNEDDELNTSFDENILEDAVAETDTDVDDGNKQQVDIDVLRAPKTAVAKPLYKGRQKNGKTSKGFNDAVINDSTKRSVRKNISNLIEQVKRQVVDEREDGLSMASGSKTLEQIAIDLIQPVIIDYLNNNLERIVSNIVNEEIKRITDDIDK